MAEGLDTLGRPVISNWMKAKIDRELSSLPDDKRGAVVVIADEHGVRAHLAARLGNRWRVAGGAGFDFQSKRLRGDVGVEFAW